MQAYVHNSQNKVTVFMYSYTNHMVNGKFLML